MPRRHSDDYGEDRAWDNYYNECHCDYDEEGGRDGPECPCCRTEHWAAEQARKRAAAEEVKLHATGWYDEITTIRHHINRMQWLTAPEYFEARVSVFGDIFTAAAGYERFLAAQPKFRAIIVQKMGECRASPVASVTLKEKLDALDAVLARLPTVEGYKA